MFRMAVGHSDDIDVDAAVEAVLAQCDEALAGEEPKAGLLFVAFESEYEPVLSAVRKRHPDIELVGSTSAGEMSSILGFQEDSIILALFASDRVDITAGLGRGGKSDLETAARQAVEGARGKTEKEPRLCLALPNVTGVNPVVLLGHLRDALGPGIPIVGGGAAAQYTRDPNSISHQFYGDEVIDDGVPVLLFSGPLSYSFGVDTGWRPVGPRGTVTRVSESGVGEIDGRPALEFYERYLGPGDPAVANPLAVFEEDADTFYLRAPISHDRETGTVRFAGTVPEGATVQLTVAATDEIFEGTKSALSKALEGYPQGTRPDAALLFSCAIRKFLLGTRTGTELDLTRELFGQDLPVAGLYCFGEIAPVASPDTSRFHNETMVALLLGSD